MRKLKYALAALAITATPIVATAMPASAVLTGCTGFANSSGSYNMCSTGTTGIMRSWVRYTDSANGFTFTSYGLWVGPGQWSNAYAQCFGTCHLLSWGRNFSG